jgi:hypothetical protein
MPHQADFISTDDAHMIIEAAPHVTHIGIDTLVPSPSSQRAHGSITASISRCAMTRIPGSPSHVTVRAFSLPSK